MMDLLIVRQCAGAISADGGISLNQGGCRRGFIYDINIGELPYWRIKHYPVPEGVFFLLLKSGKAVVKSSKYMIDEGMKRG